MAKKNVIVIGGSTGSLDVLTTLVAGLPADLDASLFITVHRPPSVESELAALLSRAGTLPVSEAVDGELIESGHIYVAAPDWHLLVDRGIIRLGRGPRENMVRPAIDPMFRSAALAYGPRVVGMVLTGKLNDGASGLSAIKRCGGMAVVQHPLDAKADEMPLAALQAADVDHVVPARDLARLIVALSGAEAGPAVPPPASLSVEVEIARGARLGSHALGDMAEPQPLTCPECKGVLSEMRNERPLRYRCQIGHAETAEVLASQSAEIEEAIGVAMRVMEERVALAERMSQDAQVGGRPKTAAFYAGRAEEYRQYAAVLREAVNAALKD